MWPYSSRKEFTGSFLEFVHSMCESLWKGVESPSVRTNTVDWSGASVYVHHVRKSEVTSGTTYFCPFFLYLLVYRVCSLSS